MHIDLQANTPLNLSDFSEAFIFLDSFEKSPIITFYGNLSYGNLVVPLGWLEGQPHRQT